MAQKKDKCCRVCRHCIWGWSMKTNKSEVKVCAKMPKTIRSDESGRSYHYAVNQSDYCENFEQV